jgi:hypothetical protein
MANAVTIHIGAANSAGYSVRNFLHNSFRNHPGHGVRNLLYNGFRNNFAYRVWNLLNGADRNLLAYRYRNLFTNAFANVALAGNLFTYSVNLEHLAAAFLRGNFHTNLAKLARLVNIPAGAGVKHTFALGANPLALGGGGNGVFFNNPFANPAGNGLGGFNRFPHGLYHFLFHGFLHIFVLGALYFLHAILNDLAVLGALYFLEAGFLNRLANGVFAFLFMLLADFLLELAGHFVAMNLGNRLAHREAAFLFALNWNTLADGVLAILVVCFTYRLANG